jgi:hypothetical protein
MSFFSFLSSRESKVKNERLEAEISKVCEDLTNGIIELSEKAKKLNELKEKYNKTTSEIQTSATPDETNKGTENKKSFFSNLFGSSNDDDAAPAAPPASPASTPDVSNTLPEETNPEKNMPAPDVTDELSQESAISAASTAPPEQLPVPDSPFSSLSDASALIKPNDSSLKSDDSSVSNSSDTFSLSSPTNDDVLQQESSAPASEPISVHDSLNDRMIPIPTADLQNKPVEGDAAPADNATNEPPKVGGKKKKSKRSKKTISNSTKKPSNSTKTKKVRYDDAKARSQGLAQAFLQAHGQT